jgi:2-hydroxychromene-2-carboxylate isomerase
MRKLLIGTTTVRACWEQNKDMSSDEVLSSAIAEAGYDAKSIMAKANSPEIKQDLRARTKEAKDTGICGVPSYRIFRRRVGQQDQDWKLVSDIIWGQDESAVVEDLISGWDGHSRVVESDEKRRESAKL